MRPWMMQFRNAIKMENPRMSSTYGKYTAEKVLARQKGHEYRRNMDYFKTHDMPFDWGVHAHVNANEFTQSSCAITADSQD